MQRNPWDNDPIVTPGGPRTVIVGPPDPSRAVSLQNQELQNQRLRQQMARDAQEDTRPPPGAGYRYTAEGNLEPIPGGPADPNSAAFQAAHPRAARQGGRTPEQQALVTGLQNDEVLRAIGEARGLIRNTWSTGFPGQILSHIGGTGAADLRAVLSTIGANNTIGRMMELKSASATGATGFGSLTEREGQLLRDSIAGLAQDQSGDQLLRHLDAVEEHYRSLRAIEAGQDPRRPEVRQMVGLVAPSAPPPVRGEDATDPGAPPSAEGGTPPSGGPPTDPGRFHRQFAQGETRTEDDPTLVGLNAHVASMIGSGRSVDEINAYLRERGVNLGAREQGVLNQWVGFIRENPNWNHPIPVNLDDRQVPMTTGRQILNTIGQSAPGAYAISAGDFLTGGNLDSMTDDPALTRAGMAGVQQMHPLASTIGTISGAALLGAGTEGALARVAPRLAGGMGLFAPRAMAADVLDGAYYGFGSSDDDRLGGALWGGVGGAVGGVGGRGAARGVSTGIGGLRDGSVRLLNDSGIRMTLGQMLGQSGRIGNAVRGIEDRMAGFPLLGSFINPARREGIEDFNRATFDQALAPIGQTTGGNIAEAGVDQAHRMVGDAYENALGGSAVTVDGPFEPALTSAVNRLRDVPRVGQEAADDVGAILRPYFGADDTLTGRNLQPLLQELQGLRSFYRPAALGHRVGQGLDEVEDSVTGMFERQAPDVMPGLQAANEANRNLSIVRDAVTNARDGVFYPGGLGTAVRNNTRRFGGRWRAASEDRPFFELQRAAQNVLPSTVGDSGTAGRLALPMILGGLGGASNYDSEDAVGSAGEGILKGIALSALLHTPGMLREAVAPNSRSILQHLLLTRPRAMQSAAEGLDRLRLPYGSAALPVALPPLLPQND